MSKENNQTKGLMGYLGNLVGQQEQVLDNGVTAVHSTVLDEAKRKLALFMTTNMMAAVSKGVRTEVEVPLRPGNTTYADMLDIMMRTSRQVGVLSTSQTMKANPNAPGVYQGTISGLCTGDTIKYLKAVDGSSAGSIGTRSDATLHLIGVSIRFKGNALNGIPASIDATITHGGRIGNEDLWDTGEFKLLTHGNPEDDFAVNYFCMSKSGNPSWQANANTSADNMANNVVFAESAAYIFTPRPFIFTEEPFAQSTIRVTLDTGGVALNSASIIPIFATYHAIDANAKVVAATAIADALDKGAITAEEALILS